MTVPLQPTIFQHVGNNVTTMFAYGCLVLDASHISVTIDGIPATGFTVTGVNQPPGGTVVFSSPPRSGANIIIQRLVPIERETDYQQAGEFRAGTVNRDIDLVWMALQQIGTEQALSIRYPYGDNASQVLPAERSNKLLSFDEAGNPIAVNPIADSSTELRIDLSNSDGGALVGFVQNLPGATERTQLEKSRDSVSILDFKGAVADGVTDCTAAMNAAEMKGIPIYWPSGDYVVTRMPALNVSYGPGRVFIAGKRTYLHPYPGPVQSILASVFDPAINGAVDASDKLQAAIDIAQDNDLFVDFQSSAIYRIEKTLTFKQGRGVSDAKKYYPRLRGNNAELRVVGNIYGFWVQPRCLKSNMHTPGAPSEAQIQLYDLQLSGLDSLGNIHARSFRLGMDGYYMDGFRFSEIKNILTSNFYSSDTVYVKDVRAILWVNCAFRSGDVTFTASSNTFCGDFVFNSCQFVNDSAVNSLKMYLNTDVTGGQVRGYHFTDCGFYYNQVYMFCRGATNQVGDTWYTACAWDDGITGARALMLDAQEGGQMFQIHIVNPYIVNWDGEAINAYADSTASMYMINLNGGCIQGIGDPQNPPDQSIILMQYVQGFSISGVQFAQNWTTRDVINISHSGNGQVSACVSTTSNAKNFISVGESYNTLITGNIANCSGLIVNKYGTNTNVVDNNNIKI